MDILRRHDLETLIEKTDGWHVSIYMPTHTAGSEIQQDPIRLKNLLDETEERLISAGMRSPEARAQLEPIAKLVEDGLFWQHQSNGLAIFCSSEGTRTFRLPLVFNERVVVADRFHIKPLLPLFSGDGRFFVLALSQDEVRLLQGTRYRVEELDLDNAPANLAEALRFDDPERHLQFHTASGPSGGKGQRPAMYHGQGAPSHDEKSELLRYFHKLDNGLQSLLTDEKDPLVLAGVDYLLPLYREANTYSHLIEKGIPGNPENLSAQELHRQAWALVESLFLQDQEQAEQHYRQLRNTEKASDTLTKVVPASHHGRVETLWVAVDVEQWGTFDPETNMIQIHPQAKAADQDLVDLAAVQTLLHGGDVYAVESQQMPSETSVAAVFRY